MRRIRPRSRAHICRVEDRYGTSRLAGRQLAEPPMSAHLFLVSACLPVRAVSSTSSAVLLAGLLRRSWAGEYVGDEPGCARRILDGPSDLVQCGVARRPEPSQHRDRGVYDPLVNRTVE